MSLLIFILGLHKSVALSNTQQFFQTQNIRLEFTNLHTVQNESDTS